MKTQKLLLMKYKNDTNKNSPEIHSNIQITPNLNNKIPNSKILYRLLEPRNRPLKLAQKQKQKNGMWQKKIENNKNKIPKHES